MRYPIQNLGPIGWAVWRLLDSNTQTNRHPDKLILYLEIFLNMEQNLMNWRGRWITYH